jgi:hypothetical protein
MLRRITDRDRLEKSMKKSRASRTRFYLSRKKV